MKHSSPTHARETKRMWRQNIGQTRAKSFLIWRIIFSEMARLFRSNPRQKAPQLCAIFSDCLAVRLQVFVYVAL